LREPFLAFDIFLKFSIWSFGDHFLYRSLDLEGDILGHPEYLLEAHRSGKELVQAIEKRD